jgi:hypothetical protein
VSYVKSCRTTKSAVSCKYHFNKIADLSLALLDLDERFGGVLVDGGEQQQQLLHPIGRLLNGKVGGRGFETRTWRKKIVPILLCIATR